jgi:suppressor for copper-sensitivity B
MAIARCYSVIMLSAGLVLAAGDSARAAATDWVGDGHVAVRLITATDSVAAASTLDAGLEFRLAKGWHGYWRTPGDAGVAPVIDWSGSENVARGEVAWPAPHRLVIDNLQNSIYENHVILPVKLFLERAGAPVRIQVSLAYGACSEVCVPYQAELTLRLPLGAGAVSAEAAAINLAQKAVPGTAAASGINVTRTQIAGTTSEPLLVVELRSEDRPFVRPDLFVEGAGDGIPAAPAVDLQDGGRVARLSVRLPKSLSSDHPLVLTLTDGDDRAAEFRVNAR